MADLKDKFGPASTGGGGYLRASLDFMVADTRQGLTDSSRADLAAIKQYAAAHPERADLATYVAKAEAAAGVAKQPAKAPSSFKPSGKF